MIKITPTQLEVVNQQLPDVDARGWVRTLVVGAEAVRGDILEFWQRHAAGTILLNEYGPTETVVGCSIYEIPVGQAISGPVPIGLPIANTQFYVLDAALRPIPTGVVGELYIGGDGVAWGYLNRPELTAERFIPDPFSSQPGARMYKTGDLVRYLPDHAANIEFLGRIDNQVKIRGYRVEPGEIEAVLVGHPAVEQAVVLAREDVAGMKQLVAYFVLTRDVEEPAVQQLHSFMQHKLPEYMVPVAYVRLEVLPLTETGKVNTRILPPPERTARTLNETFVAPRTRTEETLTAIWKEVLGLDRISIYDDFFALGGHSLLATRVVSRIRKTLQAELTLTHFFQAPTIARQAEFIEQAQTTLQGSGAKLAKLLARVKSLSDDEARDLLRG